MKKKIISLLLLAALSAGLLAACGTAQAEEIDLGTVQDALAPSAPLGALTDDLVPLAGEPAISALLLPSAAGTSVQKDKNSQAVIDYSNTQDGYIMAAWTGGGTPKLKIIVKGPTTQYNYNLKNDGSYETFPLADGNGKYTISVCKNTEGTKYAVVTSVSFEAKMTDEFAPFVRPNQYVNFTESSEAVKKAAELVKDAKTNMEKLEKVYNYVVDNTSYDGDKAKSVKSGYLPDVDDTLRTGKGICFDYAALMAAMLRSQDVPTKLIVGYVGKDKPQYHAWISIWSENEGWINGAVYFDGKEWKRMDPTFDSSAKKKGADFSEYIGDGSNYAQKYQY